MVKQFRKRPLVVEAVRWDGSNENEIQAFMGGYLKRVIEDMLFIGTLEGIMCASVGDYIIKGVKGEFYSCKPDIFAETYEDADIDPESLRPQGEWEGEHETWGKMQCSVCKKEALLEKANGDIGQILLYVTSNYCPNCGAYMEGG